VSVSSAVARGRKAAEARMTSTVSVMRKTGATTTDADGFTVPVWATVHAGVRFRLAGAPQSASQSRTLDVGGVAVTLAVRVGHFPVTVDDLQDGDLIDVTAGDNAGTVWRVVEAGFQDQSTARRVPVMAVGRPEEWV
jgi:hypothetical protein